MLTAVTYIRHSDRTRLAFILETPSREHAEAKAAEYAPKGFEYAATCQPTVPFTVPSDGDDYGNPTPSIPADWITTSTMRAAP